MTLTIQAKMIPTLDQDALLRDTTSEYIALVNDILDYAIAIDGMPKLSSASVQAPLPSALRDQARLDARSIWKKYNRGAAARLPVLRRPVAIWNNQNYSYDEAHIAFPVWRNGKSCKISVKAILTSDQIAMLDNCKRGTLRITRKSGKWIAQIAVGIPDVDPVPGGLMGVDLGLKCPAVCCTDAGKVKFIGNGRRNKQIRRHYTSRRKKLQKAGKSSAVKKLGDKENRVMRDTDHKLSRQIVDFAVSNGIGTIKMEKLQNIRQQARKSRKNNRSLHSWSFYRLASFVEYKAKLAGINVVYVDPMYTSQRCPICGALNQADDRDYICSCGFHAHRDIVGARNILSA